MSVFVGAFGCIEALDSIGRRANVTSELLVEMSFRWESPLRLWENECAQFVGELEFLRIGLVKKSIDTRK